ncbi:MAG TPA: hypothetical protein VM847_20945, partial [Tahibacter sp.]|nr:hypothetical protein [Tahibacter sp.]
MTLPRMRSRMLFRSAAFVLTFAATLAAGAAAPIRPASATNIAASRSPSQDDHTSTRPPVKTAAAADAAGYRPASRAKSAASQSSISSASSSLPTSSTHSSPSPTPAATGSPQQAVIAALLRGEDARAAIANAREQQPATPKRMANAGTSASAGYAQARDTLRALLQHLPTQRNADTVAHKRALLGAV